MAQVDNGTDQGSFATDLGVVVASTETTVLDAVPAFGFINIGITITCNSGSMASCALYGSADGTNYIAVSGFSTFALTSGQTKHGETTGIWQFLRLTATGVSNIDAHMDVIVG
jgi:hypothetical protein